MPLTSKERRVAGALHCLGQRRCLECQAIRVRSGKQLCVALPGLGFLRRADVIRDPSALRPLSGHQAGTRRRTNGTRRIGIGKPSPFLGQAIEIRRLVKRAAVTAQISLAEIIGEKDDNIGRRLFFAACNASDGIASATRRKPSESFVV